MQENFSLLPEECGEKKNYSPLPVECREKKFSPLAAEFGEKKFFTAKIANLKLSYLIFTENKSDRWRSGVRSW